MERPLCLRGVLQEYVRIYRLNPPSCLTEGRHLEVVIIFAITKCLQCLTVPGWLALHSVREGSLPHPVFEETEAQWS